MSQAEMTFWDHLEELRKTLFRAIGILLVAFVVCFIFVPKIFDGFILGPSRADFFLYEWLASVSGGPDRTEKQQSMARSATASRPSR